MNPTTHSKFINCFKGSTNSGQNKWWHLDTSKWRSLGKFPAMVTTTSGDSVRLSEIQSNSNCENEKQQIFRIAERRTCRNQGSRLFLSTWTTVIWNHYFYQPKLLPIHLRMDSWRKVAWRDNPLDNACIQQCWVPSGWGAKDSRLSSSFRSPSSPTQRWNSRAIYNPEM